MNNKQKILTFLVITLLIFNAVTVYLSSYSLDVLKSKISLLEGKGTENNLPEIDQLSIKQKMLISAIDSLYVDWSNKDLSTEDIYRMITGLLEDPHSIYLSQDDLEKRMKEGIGELASIGVELDATEDGLIRVIASTEGSPAHQSGIKTGDVILKVNGATYHSKDLNKMIFDLIGEIDSEVTLLIRNEEEKEIEITLKRGSTGISNIWHEILEGDIGYIRITALECDSLSQFKEALEVLIKNNAKGLIIDIRDSAKGSFINGVAIADEFINEGIISQLIQKEENVHTFMANEYVTDIPIVIVTNKGSAGGVEVLASALRDHNKVVIVGETTYGRGIEQNVVVFYDNTGLKISTNEYLSPNGMTFNGFGIEPDVKVVPMESEGIGPKYIETDNQLLIAIDELLKLQ